MEFDNSWHFQHFTKSVILKECLVIRSSLKCSERTESQFYLYPEDKLFIIPSLTEIKEEFVKELSKEKATNIFYSLTVHTQPFQKKKKKVSGTLLFCSQIVLCAWFDHNIYNIPELLPNVQLTILLLET